MALPVLPPPPTNDVAVTGWSGITVRIAWTLLQNGTRVRPQVLRDARDHVIYHLDPETPLAIAEDRAGSLTERFVARARGKRPDDPWPHDAKMPLSPRWGRALEQAITPLSEVVFRQHYGDNRSLDYLERLFQIDTLTLQAARGGLREVVRRAARADGVPIDDWPNERLDRLLRRIAAWAPGACPPVVDIAEGAYADHVAKCPRCDRMVRLIRSGVLDVEDLLPPSFGARPSRQASVLALQLHPDARKHRHTLARELAVPCFPVGDDLLLIDFSDPAPVEEVLCTATELGCPRREELRGAVVVGPGAFTRHGLVGPLVDEADAEVLVRSWGTIDTIDSLPESLPEPPSAGPWWAGVAVLAAASALMVRALLPMPVPDVDHPLDVAFTEARGGVWTAFDVDEDAVVALVREAEGGIEVVLEPASASGKAAFAVGDGSYRLHTIADGLLVASLDRPVDLQDPITLEQAATRIRTADPRADVRVFRAD